VGIGVASRCPGPLLPFGGLERRRSKEGVGGGGGAIRRAVISTRRCSRMLDRWGTRAPPARLSLAPTVLSSHSRRGPLVGPLRTPQKCPSIRPRSAALHTIVLLRDTARRRCHRLRCRIIRIRKDGEKRERPRDLLRRRTLSRGTLRVMGQRRGACWRGSGEGQSRR